MKSSAYYQERKKGTRIDTYTPRKFDRTRKRPTLMPVIVNNWMEDEAYIFVEKNDFLGGFSDTLTVRWNSEDSSGVFYRTLATKDQQYEFAMNLYESLGENHNISVQLADRSFAPIFEDASEKANFRRVILDYLRLTEAF